MSIGTEPKNVIRIEVLMRVCQMVAEFNRRNATRSCIAIIQDGALRLEMRDFATTNLLKFTHDVPLRDLAAVTASVRVDLIMSRMVAALDVERKADAA